MPKYKLSGDILHPGFVLVEAASPAALLALLEKGNAKTSGRPSRW
jgi:hypothetical protein